MRVAPPDPSFTLKLKIFSTRFGSIVRQKDAVFPRRMAHPARILRRFTIWWQAVAALIGP